MKQSISRRKFALASAATLASIAVIKAPAKAAQFQYKYGNDQTISSPVNVRAIQMWNAIEKDTSGKLSVKTFPDSQLGGDSQMITQCRSGALEFLTEPGALLGNVVPPASIDGLAFAFKDTKQAFAAMDGELGEYVRSEIETRGMHALPNPFDNGFRHITANKPVRNVADVDGLKIRVPVAPLFVDTWKTLGAAPTPINVSELYTALKTRIVDAEENALININQSKLFEVQKTLNFSYHAWACWWMLVNKDAWDALGPQIQAVVMRNQKKYAALQRRDFQLLTDSLTDKLHRYGMEIYHCDIASFKAKLGPYYAKWKGQFGSKAWETLEKYTGKLA